MNKDFYRLLCFRKTKECAALKVSLQQSLTSMEESEMSLSTIDENFSSLPTSISEVSSTTDFSNYVCIYPNVNLKNK